jgi:ATP-binding cassette subfamily B protein
MKPTLEEGQSQPLQSASQCLSATLRLLALAQADTALAAKFSQAFEVYEFQLGDQLVSYTPPSTSDHEPSNCDFYLVCQGRVRLLGFDQQRRRQVSALVLEEGETFGADHFYDVSLPYQAIAAGPGQVARIPYAKLEPWLETLPHLRDYLLQQTQHWQRLIFCKTSTALRSLPSHQLRQLIPYLVEEQIPAGEALVQATPPGSGYFWLRRGQIQSQSNASQPPTVGESWGYPNPIPSEWTAQTDLLVYRLPIEHWEAAQAIIAAILPGASTGEIDPSRDVIATSNGKSLQTADSGIVLSQLQPAHRPGNRRLQPRLQRTSPNSLDAGVSQPNASQSNLQTNHRQAESPSVAFPKPGSRRRQGRWFWQGYPLIRQQSASDCGVACLAMVGQYWGKRFGINYLRNLAEVDRAGTSLKRLAATAESLGFHARPVRASLSRLKEEINPWIAHWQGDHYVVVYRVKGNRVLIADPAIGQRSLSVPDFQKGWSGYALLLDPTDQLKAAEAEAQKKSLNRFWGLLWPHRAILLQIILASLLLQVFGLVTPFLTQVILDRVVVQKSLITLHVFAIGLLLFSVWRVGLVTIRQYLLDYFSNRLDLTLISGFISHTLMLPLKFFELRQVGDIITRVQENQKIQLFLTRQAISTWLDALMVFVYLGLMFYYNWNLTLLVLAIIPPIVILTLVATPLLQRISREIFNQEAAENSSLVEMLTGVATVKTAAAERDLRWRWEDLFTRTLNAQFRGQKLTNGLQAASGLINALGSTALLWYGAMLVIQDQLTIGQFVAFNMLIGNVINPILELVGLWDEFQEVVISVERLDDVFLTEPEESPQKPMLVLPRLRGDVRFEKMTFRYGQDEERNTLQNISFEVRSGQTTAIVGRSGSGKSTLVNLLQGLYHPNKGRIWMDEHDIRHVSPQSLRSQLGVVPQECFLFSGTILENITLYRPEFGLNHVVEVAKLAEAHAFIQDLPLGYNTKVGERGSNLSGGQRQRIAIARALLGNPRILILDEATSSLDTESERRFQQNLARISRDRTTFIIAHRLSTVRHADCIFVLDQGILAERGTHDELISLQGLYYHLAQQQLDL